MVNRVRNIIEKHQLKYPGKSGKGELKNILIQIRYEVWDVTSTMETHSANLLFFIKG